MCSVMRLRSLHRNDPLFYRCRYLARRFLPGVLPRQRRNTARTIQTNPTDHRRLSNSHLSRNNILRCTILQVHLHCLQFVIYGIKMALSPFKGRLPWFVMSSLLQHVTLLFSSGLRPVNLRSECHPISAFSAGQHLVARTRIPCTTRFLHIQCRSCSTTRIEIK